MRVTVVGGGEIGFALAQALAEQHEIFVVDQAPHVADRFERLDVQFVLGPGTSSTVLEQAGIKRADVLVACTGLDEVNLVTCAMARKMASPHTICFVSREEFLDLPDREPDLAPFGIDRVIWPEAQLATDIERLIETPGALDAESFADGAIRLVEYRINPNTAWTGQAIADLHLPRGSLVVAVRRGDEVFIPRGSSQLSAGDKAVLIGTPEALREVHLHVTGIADPHRQRVTIVGGGDVGLQLADRLDRLPSIDLTIIERDAARGEMIAGRLTRSLVLNGDGTDLELLESEDIGRSDVLVSVIDNDERNLLASLLARQLGVSKIITRVSRPANLRLFERVGIDVALSARGSAVASVIHHIQGGRANLLAVLEEGQATIVELEVPSSYRPRALQDLNAPSQSIVGAILRGDQIIIPRGADQIRPQDRLLVFATSNNVAKIRDYFTAGR